MKSEDVLSIDFETGSTCDLKKCGAAKYAEDPTTRVICLAYSTPWDPLDPGGVKAIHFLPGEDYAISLHAAEPELLLWVADGKPVRAWNATFEFHIWRNVFIPHTPLRLEQLHDTMAQGAYWGLPLGLGLASEALPELGIVKDMAGNRLMLSMSRPRGKPEPDGALRWWDAEDADKRDALLDYCVTDVKTEMAIGNYLSALPAKERKVWLMDAKANLRGLSLDVDLVAGMEGMARSEQHRLNQRLENATHGSVAATTKAVALKDWVVQSGLPEASGGLAKDRLPGLIEKAYSRGLTRTAEVLEIRQEAAKSSVAKLTAMKNFACSDGKMRGLTQYYGAFRTGRWAGRGPQVQNFPRSEVKDQEALVDYLLLPNADPEGLELFFGVAPLSGLSSALRGCVHVPPSEGVFAAIDFSQIEARVLAWLAGSENILDAFRSGKDLYVLAASGIYSHPESIITADQRQVGKVSVLACGYQGGVGAFQSMAKVYGLEIPDAKAEEIKNSWRETNPEIVSYWYKIGDAALGAAKAPGSIYQVVRGPQGVTVRFSMWQGHLLCGLPSGRKLIYRDAQIADGTYGDVVSYMGVNQYTRKWERLETYGGKLVENICQAVARDVMADAMLRLDPQHNILGSIHDEVLLRLPDAGAMAYAEKLMNEVPAWAAGLPVGADGYVGRRFKKG